MNTFCVCHDGPRAFSVALYFRCPGRQSTLYDLGRTFKTRTAARRCANALNAALSD